MMGSKLDVLGLTGIHLESSMKVEMKAGAGCIAELSGLEVNI